MNNIIVYVRGGLVQGVIAQNPETTNVIIVDYDPVDIGEPAEVNAIDLGYMEQLKENHVNEPEVLQEIMEEMK